MTRDKVVTSSRLAGEVQRYHAWPHLRPQTVAEHTWQVMRVFQAMFSDEMTPEVWDHLLWHDAAEIGTGDIPFPLKSKYPELKKVLGEIEAEVLDNMGISMPALTDRQRALCKIADLVEMYEWGYVEMMLGNRFAQPVVDDTLRAVIPLAREHGVLDRVEAYGRAMGLVIEEVDIVREINQ